MERTQAELTPTPARPDPRIAEAQRVLRDRDETVRLLNEALALALAELERRDIAA